MGRSRRCGLSNSHQKTSTIMSRCSQLRTVVLLRQHPLRHLMKYRHSIWGWASWLPRPRSSQSQSTSTREISSFLIRSHINSATTSPSVRIVIHLRVRTFLEAVPATTTYSDHKDLPSVGSIKTLWSCPRPSDDRSQRFLTRCWMHQPSKMTTTWTW